ncbi:hypothetical protein [uncultured Bacteroides sp.]|uniref:hypothetical protein n=1 Tax=uncultured Bacteroides sp. TaxID=162156 RepID=UPI002614CFED|nr:hypothetical protein [uncultured Bacteroides sp.]
MKTSKILIQFLILLFALSVNGQTLSDELTYLQTDKGIYETGEDLWFKSYVFDRSNLSLSGAGRTLFVEMLDGSDSIVWQEKYPIQSGISEGHIYLDKNLKPGDYRIHAYTKYSFTADTLRPYHPKLIRILKNITDKGHVQDSETVRKVSRLSFFPEGGSLIDGVAAKVAFKGTDKKGMPADVKGELREDGRRIARLESLHDGMGMFMLLPHKGSRYTAVLDDGTEHDFPDIESSGLSLHLRKQTEEYMEFLLSQQKGAAPQRIRLEGKMRGVKYCMAEGILNEILKVRIPVSEFPLQGIAEFTLYDNNGLPVAERLVYLNPKRKLNIEIKTDKERYATREKGKVSVRVSDEHGKPVVAHLGLSIFDASYINEAVPENMLSYCMLSSEIRGNIHNPAYYFNDGNKDRLRSLDLLLLTQGWRRYVWENFDETKEPAIFLSDEILGRQTIGKKRKRNDVGNVQQLLQVSGPDADTQFVMTDSMGNFAVPTEQMLALRGGYVYLKPMLDKDEYKPEVSFKADFPIADSLRSHLRCHTAFQDMNLVKSVEKFDNSVISRDSSILLSEVTVTGTKGRVFRDKMMGRLDSLAQMDVGGAWVCECKSLNHALNDYNGYSHHPEGCAETRYSGKRLRPVIGETYVLIKYEPVGENGDWILTDSKMITWTGEEFTEEELLRMNNLFRTKGYYGKREFYKPAEADMLLPMPDARNVLMWKPDIITDEKGCAEVEFFCSDINTGFVGVIEGTDGTGSLGTSQCEFRVIKH